MPMLMPRFWIRRALAAFTGLLISVALMLPGLAEVRQAPRALMEEGVPLSSQPFYPALLDAVETWEGVPLGEVIGDNPRSTLLNFCVVMAEVGHQMRTISASARNDPGFNWSPAARQRIESLNTRFNLAVEALNASEFAESVRSDRAEEAAIQLKQILDYVFGNSRKPFTIPNSEDILRLNASIEKNVTEWRLPGTAVVLSLDDGKDARGGNYLFSASTVQQVERMYEEINGLPLRSTPFTTPGLYTFYSQTPGYLVPPKWYLRLPDRLRTLIEVQIWGQTLFQILFSLITIGVLLLLIGWLGQRLVSTYRYAGSRNTDDLPGLNTDNIAWWRVLLVLPVLPLTRVSNAIVDSYLNITGTPLVVATFGFYIIYFLSASVLAYLFFEALGRSGAEWLMHLRGGASPFLLQRISNFVMPICRTLGALTLVALIYQLLLLLGLPAETVLAFSAVPGLAIGLGASKLLGNLFAGLSIQTDRPLRVGEFCRVGDNLGFVTKIGLRSLELQTLDSRITIPNAIADDATIVNFSQRSQRSDQPPRQGIEMRYALNQPLSPEQVEDLLHYARQEVKQRPELLHTLVSVERNSEDALELVCFATVELHGWQAYLELRESVLLRMQQIEDQVAKSRVVIGVSYDTTAEQLRQIPLWIKEVVEADPSFSLRSCRLMAISDFSYDYVFDFRSSHGSYAAFKDGINRMNQDLLASFARHQVDIPFPTQMEIQKD
ncbi:MAG: mechanosensitive ion channel [Cyanobacteria bacterium K_DeepCast_35m_m1_288]|nr:mechanosensitive ion channel [Cyanobacteria bacterium K_DeepCast_35m_m1_288]